MKYTLILYIFFLASHSVLCQDIIKQQITVDSLKREGEIEKASFIALKQSRASDFQFRELIYHQIDSCKNKKERIKLLKIARELRYYYYHGKNGPKAKEIYYNSTKRLIKELEGDLEQLQKIEVIPALRILIYPWLTSAIERAGGQWDRGEIAEYKPGIPVKQTFKSDSLYFLDLKERGISIDSLRSLEWN
jgi:hypothetical protein